MNTEMYNLDEGFTLSDLVDLALGTPEVGAVNFNILRILLHELLKKVNMENVFADLDDFQQAQIENFKQYLQNNTPASPIPGVIKVTPLNNYGWGYNRAHSGSLSKGAPIQVSAPNSARQEQQIRNQPNVNQQGKGQPNNNPQQPYTGQVNNSQQQQQQPHLGPQNNIQQVPQNNKNQPRQSGQVTQPGQIMQPGQQPGQGIQAGQQPGQVIQAGQPGQGQHNSSQRSTNNQPTNSQNQPQQSNNQANAQGIPAQQTVNNQQIQSTGQRDPPGQDGNVQQQQNVQRNNQNNQFSQAPANQVQPTNNTGQSQAIQNQNQPNNSNTRSVSVQGPANVTQVGPQVQPQGPVGNAQIPNQVSTQQPGPVGPIQQQPPQGPQQGLKPQQPSNDPGQPQLHQVTQPSQYVAGQPPKKNSGQPTQTIGTLTVDSGYTQTTTLQGVGGQGQSIATQVVPTISQGVEIANVQDRPGQATDHIKSPQSLRRRISTQPRPNSDGLPKYASEGTDPVMHNKAFYQPSRISPSSSTNTPRTASFNKMIKAMEDKIAKLESNLEALYSLPQNADLLNHEGNSFNVNDMWQIIQLNNRTAAAEAAIQKLASLIEDLARQLKAIKQDSQSSIKTNDQLLIQMGPFEGRFNEAQQSIDSLRNELERFKEENRRMIDQLTKAAGVNPNKVPPFMDKGKSGSDGKDGLDGARSGKDDNQHDPNFIPFDEIHIVDIDKDTKEQDIFKLFSKSPKIILKPQAQGGQMAILKFKTSTDAEQDFENSQLRKIAPRKLDWLAPDELKIENLPTEMTEENLRKKFSNAISFKMRPEQGQAVLKFKTNEEAVKTAVTTPHVIQLGDRAIGWMKPKENYVLDVGGNTLDSAILASVPFTKTVKWMNMNNGNRVAITQHGDVPTRHKGYQNSTLPKRGPQELGWLTPEGAADLNKYVLGPDGKPILDASGKPYLLSDVILRDGVPLLGPDGKPILKNQVILDPFGNPYLDKNGKPLLAKDVLFGADGRPVLGHNRQPITLDQVILDPFGKPYLDQYGDPLLASQVLFDSNGRLILGPDGNPLLADGFLYDDNGKLILDSKGAPIKANQVLFGPDGKMMRDKHGNLILKNDAEVQVTPGTHSVGSQNASGQGSHSQQYTPLQQTKNTQAVHADEGFSQQFVKGSDHVDKDLQADKFKGHPRASQTKEHHHPDKDIFGDGTCGPIPVNITDGQLKGCISEPLPSINFETSKEALKLKMSEGYCELQDMQRQLASDIQDKMEFIYQKLLREIANQQMTSSPYMAIGPGLGKCMGPGICTGHGMPAGTAVCQFPAHDEASKLTAAYRGISMMEPCPYCHGTGHNPLGSCSHCQGTGHIRTATGIETKCPFCQGFGKTAAGVTCPHCQGTGHMMTGGHLHGHGVETKCPFCHGLGKSPTGLPCPHCQGLGKTVCPYCLGLGVLSGGQLCPHCQAVVQSTEATTIGLGGPCTHILDNLYKVCPGPGICPGAGICPTCKDDALHSLKAPTAKGLDRPLELPQQAEKPLEGHSQSQDLLKKECKTLILLPKNLEELREKIKNEGKIPNVFDEMDMLERLHTLWDAVSSLKHNDEALAVRIIKLDAIFKKFPRSIIDKIQKIPPENLDAIASANSDRPLIIPSVTSISHPGEEEDDCNLLPRHKHGMTGVVAEDDIQTIFNNLSNLLVENAAQKERFQGVSELLKNMEQNMVTKHMLIDTLSDKADKGQMNTKVSYDEFGNSMDELTTRMQNLLIEVYQKNENWKNITDHLGEELSAKLDKVELAPVRAYFKSHLKTLEDRVNYLTAQFEEPDPAGTRKKLLKDFNCISCDRHTHISGVTNASQLPTFGPILAGHTTASQRAYDLHRMRQQKICKFGAGDGRDMNLLSKELCRGGPRSGCNFESAGQSLNESDVMQMVNRYVGGSHTAISTSDRIAAMHKRMSTKTGERETFGESVQQPVTSHFVNPPPMYNNDSNFEE